MDRSRIALLTTLLGCAPQLEDDARARSILDVAPPSAETATVCVYRYLASVDLQWRTWHNGQKVHELHGRGGTCYRVKPGAHVIRTEPRYSGCHRLEGGRLRPCSGTTVFEARPGKAYFIELDDSDALNQPGVTLNRTHEWVDPEVGWTRIRSVAPAEVTSIDLRRPQRPALKLPSRCTGRRGWVHRTSDDAVPSRWSCWETGVTFVNWHSPPNSEAAS